MNLSVNGPIIAVNLTIDFKNQKKTLRSWILIKISKFRITLNNGEIVSYEKKPERLQLFTLCQNRTPADRSRFKNSSWDQNKTVRENFY